MSEATEAGAVLPRAPDGEDGPLDALFFVIIALFLGKHHMLAPCSSCHASNPCERRRIHQACPGMDKNTFYSAAVGESHALTGPL